MKKSTVIMLCAGFALLVMGGAVFALTFSMGAIGYEGDFFQFGFGRHGADEPYIYDDNSYDGRETYTYGGKVYENKSLALEGANARFTQVELQLGLADTTVTQDGGPAYVKSENFPEGKLTFEVADGKLIVKDLSRNINFNFGIRQPKRQRKLTINLPPDAELAAMKCDRGVGDLSVKGISAGTLTVTDGVGSLYMENVSTNRLSLSSGVGDTTVKGLTCKGDADLTRGVGDMDVEGANIEGTVKITGGTGDFDLTGIVKGDISLEAGVGDCDLKLLGEPGDYYFTLDKGVGDLSIDDIEFSSKQKTYGQPDAPYKIDLRGGVGEIDVEFMQ